MIVVDEKTEVEPEKKVWEAMGALRDGWELRSMEKEVIATKKSRVDVPSRND
jgi:hypothetical protein